MTEKEEIERLRADLTRSEQRARRANSDLQEFVTMVSHDLREPLRTVGTYCELLSSKSPGAGGEDSELFLRYILDAVTRAQSLLAGMVDYADADPEKRRPASVDMEAVCWEAERRIEPMPGREPAAITRDPLPAVIGDFDVLTKVLHHLLDNAVKFNESPHPSVHVSATQKEGDWLFSVRDNGPGIDSVHQERIFGLFKRLHGREFRGNGLGLAFARRALESHGGRIWVESKPGEGSTFYFTLPAAD